MSDVLISTIQLALNNYETLRRSICYIHVKSSLPAFQDVKKKRSKKVGVNIYVWENCYISFDSAIFRNRFIYNMQGLSSKYEYIKFARDVNLNQNKYL